MNKLKSIFFWLLIIFPFTTLSSQTVRSDWADHLLNQFPWLEAPDTVSMVMIGDIMLHSQQIHADYGPFLSELSPRFKKADLAIANMEFTLAGEPFTGYPAFSAPDGFAQYVNEQGINVFLTANNHILDRGNAGLVRTISVYDQMEKEGKIRYTGIAATPQRDTTTYPLIFNIRGIKLALLNFTYGTNVGNSKNWPKVNRMKRESILLAIRRAQRQEADYIIALPHWGNEYQLQPSESQKEMAHWLAENGVDAIIGAHPHVIQEYEKIEVRSLDGKTRTVPVFYSIGNAVSNMSKENTRLELMVQLDFTRDYNNQKAIVAPQVEFLWCTLPGRLKDSYCTIAVHDYIDRRNEWKIPSDYDKMMETYWRVKKICKIEENNQTNIK